MTVKVHPGSGGRDYVIQVPRDHIYAQPPPENAYLLAYHARRSLRRRHRRRCLRLLLALLLLLLAAAAVLALRPRLPRFSVASLSIERFEPDHPFSAAIRAALRVENPSGRVDLRYRSGGSVEARYRGVRLCEGEWPAFRQGSGNATVVGVEMRGPEMVVSAGTRQEEGRRGEVPLKVVVRVPARAEVGGVAVWWTVGIRARCEVWVNYMNATSTVLSQSCGVHIK